MSFGEPANTAAVDRLIAFKADVETNAIVLQEREARLDAEQEKRKAKADRAQYV